MARFASTDLFEYMEKLELEVPFYAFELSRFLVPEMRGKGWRHVDGPDITPLDDYLQRSFELAQANPISPHFALNFAGHGVNSYSINTRMVIGPVLVVVQYGWGGVYMNHQEQRAKWNSGMDALYEFFNEIDMTIDIFEPPATRDLEVAIQFSDFRGTNDALIDKGDGKLSPIRLTQAGFLEGLLSDVLKHQQPGWGWG
jgi:hypothetical protein